MKIDVTQKHINSGTYHCARNCPVSLAIIEALPEGTKVDVTEDFIYIGMGARKFLTPPKVAQFIYSFDAEKVVQPFSFELPL